MSEFIPLSVPNFGPREAELAGEAITSGWVSTSGGKVTEFEEALARYLGWPEDLLTGDSSGTLTGPTDADGTTRTFTVTGDRFAGDEFQDALLAHSIKYGTGQAVIRPYVYFNMLTGKGEQGSISIAVEDDHSGTAGENAGWSATLTSSGTPKEYTYSAG